MDGQSVKRLGSREGTLPSKMLSLREELSAMRRERRVQFHWILGFQIANLLCSIALFLAVFLKQ